MSTRTSFLKLLSFFVQAHIKKGSNRELYNEAIKWFKESRPFREDHKIKSSLIIKILKACKSNPQKEDSTYVELGEHLKKKLKILQKDINIPNDTIELLNSIQQWYRTESEPSLKRIDNHVSSLNDPLLTKFYSNNVVLKQPLNKLKKTVQKLTGIENTGLTLDQAKQHREENPDLYKQYLLHRKEAREAYKKALKSIIRSSGKPHLPISEVLSKLKQGGIELNFLPKGFEGSVDENGELYTIHGLKIKGVPGGSVKMNPNYDPKDDSTYVFTAQIPGGTSFNQYRTYENLKRSKEKRFDLVETLDKDSIDKVKSKWRKDLMANNSKFLPALIAEIIYQTQARIGNVNAKTKGKQTYGISTLRAKHIRFNDQGVTFSYIGKSGVHHVYKILNNGDPFNTITIKYLKKLVNGKEPKDYVFTQGRGTPIRGSQVNSYMQSIGWPTTIHKIRHAEGTAVLREILDKAPNMRQAAAEQYIKDSYLKVGKILHHKNAKGQVVFQTSMGNYCSPKYVLEWLNKRNLRVPKFMKRILREHKQGINEIAKD